MGELHTFYGGKAVRKNIVDVLTENGHSAYVWMPKVIPFSNGHAIRTRELVCLNGVCAGHLIRMGNGLYERGMIDPCDKGLFYLISAETRCIEIVPNRGNIFHGLESVLHDNRFVWDGPFREILGQFRDRGYSVP